MHRINPSLFETSAWNTILKFPMVSGFLLDFMHLVDGGVLADWLEEFLAALKKKDPVYDANMTISDSNLRAMVGKDVPDRIDNLNKYRMLEQTRPIRYIL